MSSDKETIESLRLINKELKEIASATQKEAAVIRDRFRDAQLEIAKLSAPIPMHIPCPNCRALHIDEGEFATKVHHTHACQNCGLVWRPAIVATVGVRFLPGFKNDVK